MRSADRLQRTFFHGKNRTATLPQEQIDNRMILRKAMVKAGFRFLPEEWWHFTLKDESYPDTYFDFPVDMPEN